MQQVVGLQPDNVDALEQLAVAYGNLGDLERSRMHLERVVELAPDRVDSRVRLATVHLDKQRPAAAMAQLEAVLEHDPEDPDAPWLMGRAQLLDGDTEAALAAFEEARERGLAVPKWARNEWGRALAQTGRVSEALAQFRAVLELDPENAQALFFIGLVLEGQGQKEAAIERYCDSLRAQPGSPAGARLQALGRSCG